MKYDVKISDRTRSIDVEATKQGYLVSVDGGPKRPYTAAQVSRTEWLLRDVDGQTQDVVGLWLDKDRFDAQVGGHGVRGEVVDPRRAALALAGGAGKGEVHTQMPGAVARVLVEKGHKVAKGQVLLVVEAMKMENEFKAPIDGVVVEVHVRAGMAVEANALLVTLTAE